jgi:hypothetical protein
VLLLCSPCRSYTKKITLRNINEKTPVCGGGVECLHRDPASRRRWQKGSFRFDRMKYGHESLGIGPEKTTLARTSSTYKRQTHPLVKGGAPQKQANNCQRVINIWSWAPDQARHQDLLIDWLSIAMWLWLWNKSMGQGGHTSRSVACCEIASKKGWTKGTNCCSCPFEISTSPERESQHYWGLFRKPVHISWPMWRKPWATGGGWDPSLLAFIDGSYLGKVGPCDIQKLVKTFKLRKACRTGQ